MEDLVIQTRITPPKTPRNIISRKSLTGLLSDNIDKKMILITGAAGYGKTTLINEYIYQSKKRFAWVHINKDIDSPYQFLNYLTHSLRKIRNEFGEITLKTISLIREDSSRINDINSAIDEITGTFTNEFLSRFDEKIILVLDDMHEITDHGWHTYLLDKLISESPDNLQLIVITRHQPLFNISNLRAKRDILEITQKELSFSSGEIKYLAKELYSKTYSNEEINYFESSIGGWVTGIHLMIQALGGNFNIKEVTAKLLPDNLFDYFANEIFSIQDEKVQSFLLTTAYLENFDAEICGYLTGNNNSLEILEYLLGKNIFIESIQISNGQESLVNKYDYNQLFRTFLIKKSQQVFGEAELKNIFKKISAYYTELGNTEPAIEYSLLAKDWDNAVKLLNENFYALFNNGRFEKLWLWISALDESLILTDKTLLYFKGLLSKYYKGEYDTALQYIDKSIELAEKENNPDFLITCMISKSEILLNQGKINIALDILTKLKEQKTSNYNRAKIFYFLGNAYFNSDKYDESLKYLEMALELCKEYEINDLIGDVYNFLGNININRGEYVLSIHYYELTLNKTSGLFKKLVVYGNLSILHSRSGKFLKAKEYLNNANELLKLFTTPIFKIAVKLTEYTLYYEIGDYESAYKLALEINNAVLKSDNLQHKYLSYLFLGECNYYLNNIEKALDYYNLAENFIDNTNEFDRILLNLQYAICRSKKDNKEETEIEMLRAYTYLDTISYSFDKLFAGYYLAQYYYKNNNINTSLKYLEKTLTLAKEKEYTSFLQRELLASKELFSLAIESGIHKDTIKSLYVNVIDILNADWISSDYRQRLKGQLENLFDLKMTAFGSLEFIVRGAHIPESKWIRKKPKLILAYLLLSKNNSISKDKIIDMFFQDTSVDNIDNVFHQAISSIRTAMKQDTSKSKEKKKNVKENTAEPNFIVYESKILRLNPDFIYYSDTVEFDKLINAASSPETDNAAKIKLLKNALELYKGDLLEGYYEPWCEDFREEYKNKFIKNAELLLKLLSEENNYEELSIYADRLIQSDKLNEKAYLKTIKSNIKTGKLNVAKAKYSQMLKTFEDELGEKPSKEILEEIEGYFNSVNQ